MSDNGQKVSLEIRAYHFVGSTLRDGRPVPPVGEWLVHDGPVVMCQSGLHASRHPFDALMYAPGRVLCLVDCDEIDAEDVDKLVCRCRRIVARFDATGILRAFARRCALDVIDLWDAPQVVRDYLTTGDESLRDAAGNAAYATRAAAYAARAAAYAARAASYAARAASYAAGTAVYAVADAVYAAGAAVFAAGDAARAAQRERFARLVADYLAGYEHREDE